jgi:hypothetical protein
MLMSFSSKLILLVQIIQERRNVQNQLKENRSVCLTKHSTMICLDPLNKKEYRRERSINL